MKARFPMDRHTQLMERVYVQLVQETLLNEGFMDSIKNAFGGKAKPDPFEMRAIEEIGEFMKSNGRFFYELSSESPMTAAAWLPVILALKSLFKTFQYSKTYKNLPSLDRIFYLIGDLNNSSEFFEYEKVKLKPDIQRQVADHFVDLRKEFEEAKKQILNP